MSDLGKLDVLTPLSCTQIPRLDMCRSILSLSKMIQQLWCNHPLSQRNKTIKKVVGMEVAGDGKRGGGGGDEQNSISGDREYRKRSS